MSVHGPLVKNFELLNLWNPGVDVSVIKHLHSYRFYLERAKAQAEVCLKLDVKWRIELLINESALEYKNAIEPVRTLLIGQFYSAFENPVTDECTQLLNLVIGISNILDSPYEEEDTAEGGKRGLLRDGQRLYAEALAFFDGKGYDDDDFIDLLADLSKRLGDMMTQRTDSWSGSPPPRKTRITEANPFPPPAEMNLPARPIAVQQYVKRLVRKLRVSKDTEVLLSDAEKLRERDEYLDSSSSLADSLCDLSRKYVESLSIARGDGDDDDEETPLSIEIPAHIRELFLQPELQPSPVSTISHVTLVVFGVLMSQVFKDHSIHQYLLSRCENPRARVDYILNLLPPSWISLLVSSDNGGGCFVVHKSDFENLICGTATQSSLSSSSSQTTPFDFQRPLQLNNPEERQRMREVALTGSAIELFGESRRDSSFSTSSQYFDDAGRSVVWRL